MMTVDDNDRICAVARMESDKKTLDDEDTTEFAEDLAEPVPEGVDEA